MDRQRYRCTRCGYVYNPIAGEPTAGIAQGVAWEQVGTDFVCPLCGQGKQAFDAYQIG